MVPQQASLTLDWRPVPGETVDNFLKKIQMLFDKIKADDKYKKAKQY